MRRDSQRQFLKRRPPAVARWVLNAPVLLYRVGLGFLFGHRLLVLVHRGRRSGRILRTPLEVAHYDPDLGEAVVIAPWHADWVKNIEASPALAIWIGRTHFRPVQRFLSTAEVANILEAYRRKGRLEASGIARLLGWKADLSAAERQRIAAGIFAVAFSSPSTTRPAATPDR